MLSSQDTSFGYITTNTSPINGEMPVAQILGYLTEHGCKDISTQLNPVEFSILPLSTGGAGDIYGGRLTDQTKVAIKCLRLRVGSSNESKRDLRRAAHELYVWSKCQHPNILELAGVAVFHGQIAMVSSWMDRGTVTWFASQHPIVDRYTLCTQIGEGVAYLHSNNVVHGDLKGANILVSNNGTPKITDFGTASMGKYTLKFDNTTGLPGMTLRWAAPELVKGESGHTAQADVYALGMTYLEVITGSEPYYGIAEHAIMWKIVQGVYPTRPVEHMPTGNVQHDQMWSLLETCWAYNPQGRPTSTQALDQMKFISSREPNYESISEVLDALMSFGYRDCTSMLKVSSIRPTPEGSYTDYEIFEATTPSPEGGVMYLVECPRDSYFGVRSKAVRYAVRQLYIWSKCEHPNILKPFGVAEYSGRLAIIHLPSNQTLSSYLRLHPEADRLLLCIQLVDAAIYLHSQGIIHGNVSQWNIMVSGRGAIVLDDFSNAILELGNSIFPRDSLLEPHYLAEFDAPERYTYQETPTREAEVWALAMMVVTIITDRSPLDLGLGDGPVHVPTPLNPTLKDLRNPRGRRLWRLLRACFDSIPQNRPTALQVLNELKEIGNMPSSQDQSQGWKL